MNFVLDLTVILQGVAIGGIGMVIKGIVSINRKLGAMNGRVGKIETWQEDHTKLDDERNNGVLNAISELRKRVQL